MRDGRQPLEHIAIRTAFATADWVKPHVPGWARSCSSMGPDFDKNALGSILYDIENKRLCDLNDRRKIESLAKQLYNIEPSLRTQLMTLKRDSIGFLLQQTQKNFEFLIHFNDEQLNAFSQISIRDWSKIKRHQTAETETLLALPARQSKLLLQASSRTRKSLLREPQLIPAFCLVYGARTLTNPHENCFTSYTLAEHIVTMHLFDGYDSSSSREHTQWFASLKGAELPYYTGLSADDLTLLRDAKAWRLSQTIGVANVCALLKSIHSNALCLKSDWETQQQLINTLHELSGDERTKLFGLDFDERTLLQILSLPQADQHQLLQQEAEVIVHAVTLLNSNTEYGASEDKGAPAPKNAWQLVHKFGYHETIRRLNQQTELADIQRHLQTARHLNSGLVSFMGMSLGGRGAFFAWSPTGIKDIVKDCSAIELPTAYPTDSDDVKEVDAHILRARSILTQTASQRLSVEANRDADVGDYYEAIRSTWPDLTSAPSPTSELSSADEEADMHHVRPPSPTPMSPRQ